MKCKFDHEGDCCNNDSVQYMARCKPENCDCPVPISNYEYIKSMSVDELACLFYGIIRERDMIFLDILKENGLDASLLEISPEIQIAYHKQWLETEVE